MPSPSCLILIYIVTCSVDMLAHFGTSTDLVGGIPRFTQNWGEAHHTDETYYAILHGQTPNTNNHERPRIGETTESSPSASWSL
jgi:hypothetical protein